MNTTISRGILTALGFLGCGCGTKIAETATKPGAVIGEGGIDAARPASCGTTLASRLSITTIDVDDDIRYKREGYDGIPTDARIAFGVAPSGNSYVAWTNNAFTNVHVTPLTALQTRLGADTLVPGYDIGGLVAQDDGFALLVNQDDPGTPAVNTNTRDQSYGKAVVVVRVKQGNIAFTAPLTGTASIAYDVNNPLHDCAPERFDGRISFLGGRYGAYFTVHGCQGDPHESYYADKLIYLDDQRLPLTGGWNWGCQIDEDLRLLPETGAFTALCMTDNSVSGGLNLVREGTTPFTLLAAEFVQKNVCAGQFGSILKLADTNNGYMVVWLSRGGSNSDNSQPARPGNDIALMHLAAAPAYTSSAITWVTNTPNIHETNLHVAAYGPSRFLVAWDSVENFDCSRYPYNVTCLGHYGGTHFRLMDAQGNFLTPDEVLPVPPNSRDDMVIFPNGDVGWVFVPDASRNYAAPLPVDAQQVPLVATKRQISIARLIYCPAQ